LRPCSYGFRPNRRAQDAISEIHLFATSGYEWVLDADIKACFDEISHLGLMCWVTRCLSMVATFGVRMLELRGVVGRPPPSAGAWVESV